MNKLLKALVLTTRPGIKFLLRPFFSAEYLSGRHFQGDSLAGCLWGIQSVWQRSILRLGRPYPFPAGLTCRVSNGKNISFHADDLNNFQSPGTYFQNFAGRITLGRGCYIAANVGIITANHDPSTLDQHLPAKDVVIGEQCWIGMNSVIMPGVILGPKTIVGAGSVVTRSFPEGHCTIVGSPARPLNISASKEQTERT